MIIIRTGGEKSEVQDWATMVEEEEWKSQHDKVKLDKKDVRVDDVLVATCGDDGYVRVWRPLRVNLLWFVITSPSQANLPSFD